MKKTQREPKGSQTQTIGRNPRYWADGIYSVSIMMADKIGCGTHLEQVQITKTTDPDNKYAATMTMTLADGTTRDWDGSDRVCETPTLALTRLILTGKSATE